MTYWCGSVDRKSVSGYCFKLNECSSVISWHSKKLQTDALNLFVKNKGAIDLGKIQLIISVQNTFIK